MEIVEKMYLSLSSKQDPKLWISKRKYADKMCIGCKTKEESGEEMLICENLNYENRVAENPISFN